MLTISRKFIFDYDPTFLTSATIKRAGGGGWGRIKKHVQLASQLTARWIAEVADEVEEFVQAPRARLELQPAV